MDDRREGERRQGERRSFRRQEGRRDPAGLPRRGARAAFLVYVLSAAFVGTALLCLAFLSWQARPSADLQRRAEAAGAQLAPLLERSGWLESEALIIEGLRSSPPSDPAGLSPEERVMVEALDTELGPLLAGGLGPASLGRALGGARVLLGQDARARRPLQIALTAGEPERRHEASLALAALLRREAVQRSSFADRRFGESVARAVLATGAGQLGQGLPGGGAASYDHRED